MTAMAAGPSYVSVNVGIFRTAEPKHDVIDSAGLEQFLRASSKLPVDSANAEQPLYPPFYLFVI